MQTRYYAGDHGVTYTLAKSAFICASENQSPRYQFDPFFNELSLPTVGQF